MTEINHIALAQAFGARISHVARPGFGFFSALKTIGLTESLKEEKREHVVPAEDHLIAQAFEETREGLAPDVVMSNPPLKKKFLERCWKLGVSASGQAISKRLVAYRKSKNLGVELKPSTAKSDANPRPYLRAAEFAYVQTNYRFGVSIDDLMFDDDAVRYFLEMAEKITPGGRQFDYVTAALYLRKTRNFKSKEIDILRRIESATVEPRFRSIATLDQFTPQQVPDKEGIFLFSEKAAKDRPLYIGSTINLREAVVPFVDLSPFKAVANHFWTPKPENILLRVAQLHDFEGIPTKSWALKLIHDRDPLYNVPVRLKAA
jgi:hypothetical protein